MNDSKAFVIFDLDGTVIDSMDGIQRSVNATLQQQGFEGYTLDMRDRIGPPIEKVFKSFFEDLDDRTLALLVDGFRSHYDSVGFLNSRLFPGIQELLTELLEREVTMFVLTNKKVSIARRILEHLGILHCFASVNCPGNLVPPASSKKEAAARLFSDLRAVPSRVFFLGDGRDDFEAALACNWKFVLASYGYGYSDVLLKAPYVQQAFNPLELLNFLHPDL
jgi:phosphoglycolate phosphatase